MKKPTQFIGSWRMRRRFLFVVTLFCSLMIAYANIWGRDTRVSETTVEMAFIALIMITGAYVFGAAWQDISAMRMGYKPGTSTEPWVETPTTGFMEPPNDQFTSR